MSAIFGRSLETLSFTELNDECMKWYYREVLPKASHPCHGHKETAALHLHGIIRTIEAWQDCQPNPDLEAQKLQRDFEAMPLARVPEEEWIRRLTDLSNKLAKSDKRN